MRIQTIVRFIGAIMVVGIVAFLALRPSPQLREIVWLPAWLGKWADANGVLRNVPAFAFLYLVLLGCVGWRRRVPVMLLAGLLAAVLEVAQLGIPGRYFGWDDIGASWLGIAAVAAAVEFTGWVRRARSRERCRCLPL